MVSLALKAGLLYHAPQVQMLAAETDPRACFFEDEQIGTVLRHSPDSRKP